MFYNIAGFCWTHDCKTALPSLHYWVICFNLPPFARIVAQILDNPISSVQFFELRNLHPVRGIILALIVIWNFNDANFAHIALKT